MTRAAITIIMLALATPAACSAQAPQDGTRMMIAAPPGTAKDLGSAAGDPAATALAALVARQIGGDYRIQSARFFRMQAVIGWNSVSKFVAGQRSSTGMPPSPRFHDGGLDLIDLYPAEGGKPAFAVAMAQEPLADGGKLVGYFELGPP
ncbi:hypothetical protein [Sphingosinicella sp. BN140058]|uniref:hypothetical protein n=1 Tax=Sphingosinicella sp. BN140058 TaxID=1892855 RepID=UPI001012DFC5|nr:hypothetical protein [Sphingosinicella sp. BN140058]QAY76283.1 hypothetical protein ETR14_06885 [Sphingosinicella sp. BN140058]